MFSVNATTLASNNSFLTVHSSAFKVDIRQASRSIMDAGRRLQNMGPEILVRMPKLRKHTLPCLVRPRRRPPGSCHIRQSHHPDPFSCFQQLRGGRQNRFSFFSNHRLFPATSVVIAVTAFKGTEILLSVIQCSLSTTLITMSHPLLSHYVLLRPRRVVSVSMLP